jgi:hypothetical protein
MYLTRVYILWFKNQNKNCFPKFVTLFLLLDILNCSELNCFYFLGNSVAIKHVFKK